MSQLHGAVSRLVALCGPTAAVWAAAVTAACRQVEKKLKPFNLDGRKFVQQMASDGVLFTQALH